MGGKNISFGYHKSVLLKQLKRALSVSPRGGIRDAWVVDATVGDGGHSIEMLKLGFRVLGIDVDPNALDRVRERFGRLGIDQSRYILIQGNFRNLKKLIEAHFAKATRAKQTETVRDGKHFKAVLFDLGVSSLQLEDPARGFSFAREGPLDMRMDPNLKQTALDLVNTLGKGELYEIFAKLGEEKYAKKLADTVVLARQIGRFESTLGLAKLISSTIPKSGKIHPATRVFQALRIAINDELNALNEALPQALGVLERGGLVMVISFHSLEDRIVKNNFKLWQEQGFGQILTKRPIEASAEEVRVNPRSRSAKLRLFKKA